MGQGDRGAAACGLARSSPAFALVLCDAVTGKISRIKAVNFAHAETGGTLYAVALADRTAQRLGVCSARTLTGFLAALERQGMAIMCRGLIVVDEASMVGIWP